MARDAGVDPDDADPAEDAPGIGISIGQFLGGAQMYAVGAQCARELGVVGDEGRHVLLLRRLDEGARHSRVERAAGRGQDQHGGKLGR